MTRAERDASVRGIQISAQIHALRRLAARTTEVFAAAQRAGWTSEEVAARLLGILDKQREHDHS
jgi:hypothetical protein